MDSSKTIIATEVFFQAKVGKPTIRCSPLILGQFLGSFDFVSRKLSNRKQFLGMYLSTY